jgi:hypothetical protein
MAKKVNLMKLVQAGRGQAGVTSRWPAPVSPALYLMQLRLPRLRISPTKRKLPVLMGIDAAPQPVKIRHVA